MTGISAGSQGSGLRAGSQGTGVAGGGGGGGITYKGSIWASGDSGAGPDSLDLSSLSPAEGDLLVMFYDGAGGLTNAGLPDSGTSITTIPTSGRLVHKILGPGETTTPNFSNISLGWHFTASLFSGAVLSSGLHGAAATGSDSLQTVGPVTVPQPGFLLGVAIGASGQGTVYDGSGTWDVPPLVDILDHGVPGGSPHAMAVGLWEGTGAPVTYTHDHTSTRTRWSYTQFYTPTARRQAHAIIVPAE